MRRRPAEVEKGGGQLGVSAQVAPELLDELKAL